MTSNDDPLSRMAPSPRRPIRWPVANQLEAGDRNVFRHGACHIFALTLHQMYGYELFACRSANGGIVHCYAKRNNGDMIDAGGRIDPKQLQGEFKFVADEL